MKKANSTIPANQRGFTMIELMITVTLVAILAGLAAPSMQIYAKNSRLTGATQELIRSLQTARSEASKRQQRIVVCASSNPTAGDAAACATTSITGWFVFQDTNSNGTHATDGTEPVIHTHVIDTTRLNLRGNGAVTYLPTGFLNPGSATALVICDERGAAASGARGVDISETGRPHATKNPTQIDALLNEIGTGVTCP